MFGPREYTNESAEYQMKPSLGIPRRKFGNRRLLSNNGLQFRDQAGHQLSVRTKRLIKGIAPVAQLLFALAQKWAGKALKGLRQGGIRNIALVLIELARRKKATRRNKGFVQLINDCRFADTRIARN